MSRVVDKHYCVLGKFSRNEGLFPLEEAVRRLSALPAQNLKLKKRGMLKSGYFADVVIFDPEKVKDNATFQKPHQYAEGVEPVYIYMATLNRDKIVYSF